MLNIVFYVWTDKQIFASDLLAQIIWSSGGVKFLHTGSDKSKTENSSF